MKELNEKLENVVAKWIKDTAHLYSCKEEYCEICDRIKKERTPES